jgi:hypothetical protein
MSKCLSLRISPIPKQLAHFCMKLVQNNQKMYFYAVFSCGAFGHLNGPKTLFKTLFKGPQVGGMYVLMSKLKNGLLTKPLGTFL